MAVLWITPFCLVPISIPSKNLYYSTRPRTPRVSRSSGIIKHPRVRQGHDERGNIFCINIELRHGMPLVWSVAAWIRNLLSLLQLNSEQNELYRCNKSGMVAVMCGQVTIFHGVHRKRRTFPIIHLNDELSLFPIKVTNFLVSTRS